MKTKLLIVAIILASAFSAFANNDKYRLILVDDPATTITVAWNQISGTAPTLHYDIEDHGTDYSLYEFSKTEDRAILFKGMDNRFVRLTGLTPNTDYYFVLHDSEGTSQRFWFRTAPDDNSRLSFIAGGDSRNNQTPRQNANLLVSKLKPHAVFFAGDMTDGNSGPEWEQWFDDWQLTTASDGRMFPIIPAMGNHEYDANDLLVESETIYNLFDTAENSYYAVTFGAGLIRAYTLNTQVSVLGNQRDWLANDLTDVANVSVTWKMAQYHKPMRPHTNAKNENTFIYTAWAQLFYDEGVRLVVDCDSHMAKTTWPVKPSSEIGNDEGFVIDQSNGTVYTGEGCWGAPLRDNDDDKSWTRNSGSFNQFKLIFVEPSKIELRTIAVHNADLVGEVSNTDPFTLPVNLDVFSPATGAVVTISNTPPLNLCPASIGSACDDGDANTIFDEFDNSCNCVGLPNDSDLTELNVPVATSTDDAEEFVSSGEIDISSSDLELVQDTNDQIIGVRFNNVQIPDGATLYRAYIQFETDEIGVPQETTNLIIHGELTSSSETFNSFDYNISSRALTATSVAWNPLQEWSYEGEAGVPQRTSNLKDIVEEITALSGWNYGNALTFIISGSGKRVAESKDGAAAPVLKLFYKSNCPISSIVANAQTPCDYTDNTFTQDLTVTYNDAPATGTLDINGQSFAITTSPQTVTLTLDSNSNDIDVTASFSDNNTCIFTAENLFSAPSFCNCPISSIVANSQSVCNPSDNTYTQEVTVTYYESLAVGTLEVNGQSFTTGTSPQTVTLTNLDSNSNDIDVTAYFSGTTDCVFTAENLFSAPSYCNPDIMPNNVPDDTINLALLSEAGLSGSVSNGRGTPETILYDPSIDDYYIKSSYNEYGVTYGVNLGTPDVDNGFEWQVNWPGPKYINYITFGGTYVNQPQPNTMWRISYRNLGNWTTLDEGQGGWIDSGIYEWGGGTENPIEADAIRVQLYSDGIHDVIHIHLRARGGVSNATNDSTTTPKATLIQYLSPGNSCGVTIPAGSFLYCSDDWINTDGPDDTTGTKNTIIADGIFTIDVDTDVEVNDLEISSGATVIVKEGGSLTVKGDLINNGNLELESISTKYSSLIVEGTSTGDVVYKRHINTFNNTTGATTGQNDLISAPVTNASHTFGVFRATNTNIPSGNIGGVFSYLFGPFDNSANAYINYTVANDVDDLEAGIGYRTASTDTSTFTFVGDVNTSTVPVAITTGTSSAWNLIGNPYPSYINSGDFLTENAPDLDENAIGIYGYDGTALNGWTVINFANMNQATNIAPGQGFMVKAEAPSATLEFTPNMRRAGTADDFILGRTATSHYGHIKLNLLSGQSEYNTDFYFNSNATSGLDPGYDAALYDGNPPAFSIYSHLVANDVGTPFAIQALSHTSMNDITVSLGVNASQGQEITISILETDMPDDIEIYLEDTANNSFTLLNINDYVFTADSNISGIGRFYLRFNGDALNTIESTLEELIIFTDTSEKSIVIAGKLQSETKIKLYDIRGRAILVDNLDISNTRQVLNVSHLNTGIYIIELEGETTEKRIQKLVIR